MDPKEVVDKHLDRLVKHTLEASVADAKVCSLIPSFDRVEELTYTSSLGSRRLHMVL